MMTAAIQSRRGWLVTAAGLTLNLALGVLYAWSIFSKQLTEAVGRGGYGWSRTTATLPYTLAIACFALTMVPAGRLQDRYGPRLTATLGAVLCGLGLVMSGFGSPEAVWPVLVGFGLLTGTGIGLGYAAAMPAAVKWFPPQKKGLIAGLVVSGFGLAPVYIAPLSTYLLAHFGVNLSFWILGGVFLVVAGVAAQFLVNPPPLAAASPSQASPVANPSSTRDLAWREVVKTGTFYSLFLQYACASTAGLMIIGHIAKIAAVQSDNTIKAGFLFVAVLAIFNAGGRVVAGLLSDKIGRVSAMACVFTMQCVVMSSFNLLTSMPALLVGTALVGFNYGACLALFPATAADYWGTKNLGLNYGLLFLAWGLGGVFGPLLAGAMADASGSYVAAYHIAAGLLALAAFMALASYINVDIQPEERQVVLSLRKRP